MPPGLVGAALALRRSWLMSPIGHERRGAFLVSAGREDIAVLHLAAVDEGSRARASERAELYESARAFLDARTRALASLSAAAPDVVMLLRRTWMALLMNGHLSAAQYEVLMRDADGLVDEGDADVAAGGDDGSAGAAVRPLMRVEIPHVMREDI